MPAFLLCVAAFLAAIGPHYFLRLGYLTGAYGAQLTLNCEWLYHPEILPAVSLLLIALLGLRTRWAYAGGLLAGLAIAGQGTFLEPVSFFLGEENLVLILAHRLALRAHEGIRLYLVIAGLVVSAISLLGLRPVRHVSRHRLSMLLLSIRNLQRRRFRSASLVVAISTAVGAVFAYTLLMRTVENTLEVGAGRLGADLMVVPSGQATSGKGILLSGEPATFYMPASKAETVRGAEGVERVSPQVYVRPLSYTVCCSMEEILIVGYDPATDFTIAPWIEYVLKERQEGAGMVVGQGVKYYPGQEVKIYNETVKITGSLDKTGLGFFDNSAFMNVEEIRRLTGGLGKVEHTLTEKDKETLQDLSFTHLFHPEDLEGQVRLPRADEVSAIFVKVRDGVPIASVVEQIRKTVTGVDIVEVKASTRSAKEHIAGILSMFILPIVVLWLMCIGMVGGVYAMSVNERKREIGLLRAMGARRGDVSRLLLMEVLILSGLAAVIGLELGVAVVLAFIENVLSGLNLIFVWPAVPEMVRLLVGAVLLALVTGFMAALYPALRSSRLEPYAVIREGE